MQNQQCYMMFLYCMMLLKEKDMTEQCCQATKIPTNSTEVGQQ